jgi:hypothetical protein
MRIGRLGYENLKTAGQALANDPMTAVKVARHHGWDGARTGFVVGQPAPAAVARVGAATGGKISLVPGRDYEVIKITDDLSPADKRKARIANSKAKSAAMKAAKAAAGGAVAEAPMAAAVPGMPAVAAPAAPAAQAVNIEPPQIIDITDAMSPEETRKARIANSKAKSAFNKALKAAGIEPADVEIKDGQVVLPGGGVAVAAAPIMAADSAAPAPTAAAAATAVPTAAANVPEPAYIEIIDGMDPADMRKARIENAKLRSAYNKALKAAGIDPASLKS